MVNVVNPPRKSLGPSAKRQAEVAQKQGEEEPEEVDELDSSQESLLQVNLDASEKSAKKSKAAASSSSSARALPPAPAPMVPSPVASSSKIPIQPSPSPQPEEDPVAPPPADEPIDVDEDDEAPPPPPPAPTPSLPLFGLKIVPSGKFSQSVFDEMKEFVESLGGTWPDKFSIDRSASVVVIGRDIKPASSNKIMKKDLQSVVGLDGLKNWVEERRKEIEVQEEVVEKEPSPEVDEVEPPVNQEEGENKTEPAAKKIIFKAKDNSPLSFWVERKIPASVRKDVEELLTSHGGTLAPRDEADFRLVDPTTQVGRADLAEDSRNARDTLWRARPWHWVHASVTAGKFLQRKELESKNPVFVKPLVEGGAQLVCYIAKSLEREMPYLGKRIRSYGGVLTKEKSDATVLIVNEDTNDNPSTKSIKNNFGSDTKKFIVPYQWIQRSIEAQKPPVLVRHGPRKDFTPEEDAYLAKFIAQVTVEQERGTIKEGNQSMKKKGEKMYQYLCYDSNARRWPWAKSHPHASWRERYRKDTKTMDPIIDQLCWDLRKNGKFEDGFGEEQPEDATDKRTSNASASSSKPANGKKRARTSSDEKQPSTAAAAPPSPKRARTALAPRDRSASRVDEEEAPEEVAVAAVVEDQQQEDEEPYDYPADDDNMAQDDTDYSLREDEDDRLAAGDVPMDQEEPNLVAVKPIQADREQEEYDEEDRRALAGSLRMPVEEVRELSSSSKAEAAQEQNQEGVDGEEDDDDDSDDGFTKALENDIAFAERLPETQSQFFSHRSDDQDEIDEEMYDVSGVLAEAGDDANEDEEVEEQEEEQEEQPVGPQVVVDTVDSPPRTTSRVTRSRSAVSVEPAQKSTTTKNGGSAVVARRLPSLGVEGAETVPHLEIVSRKASSSSSRRSSKSKSPSARLDSPEKEVAQVVRSYSNTVSGALSELTTVASQAIEALSSPRTSFRAAASRSPAPPQARIRNVPSGSPSPSTSRGNASVELVGSSSTKPNGRPSSSTTRPPTPFIPAPPKVNIVPPPPPAPVLTAAEKKRKQEAAMAWSLAAAQRWNIPVLAAVQVLRQSGGNYEVADEKLREEQEREHEWTKEEDEIVLRGSAQDTKDLQAKVGPMVFIARLTRLRS